MRRDVIANRMSFEPIHGNAYYPKVSVADSGERLEIEAILSYPTAGGVVMKHPNKPESKIIFLDPEDHDFRVSGSHR